MREGTFSACCRTFQTSICTPGFCNSLSLHISSLYDLLVNTSPCLSPLAKETPAYRFHGSLLFLPSSFSGTSGDFVVAAGTRAAS